MLTRIGSPIASAIAALAVTIALSGVALGVALVADTTPLDDQDAPALIDTTATFEDVDGDGIDDDCQAEPAVADLEAEVSAASAVDLDEDGTISTSEAAKSDRIGGKNCNHGGYVSGVAKADDEDAEDEDDEAKAECEAASDEETETPDEDAETPAEEPAPEDGAVAPNAHGKAVSEVAKSDAVGGKNCNHGGAVSEAAHADKAEKAAERAAAKAERAAERAAEKAERAAARAAAKAEREAAKGN